MPKTRETKYTNHSLKIYLDTSQRREWEKAFEGEKLTDHTGRIDTVGASFSDGCDVLVGLIGADPAPYIEVILFGPNGTQIDCSPPLELFDEVEFVLDQDSYFVEVM